MSIFLHVLYLYLSVCIKLHITAGSGPVILFIVIICFYSLALVLLILLVLLMPTNATNAKEGSIIVFTCVGL